MSLRLPVAVASDLPGYPLVDLVGVDFNPLAGVCPSARPAACVAAAYRADVARALDCSALVDLPLRTVGGIPLDEAFEMAIVRDLLPRSAPSWLQPAAAVRGVRWNGVYRPLRPWGVCAFWRWLAVRAAWPLVRSGLVLDAYQGFVDLVLPRGPLFGLAVPVAAVALFRRGLAPLAYSLDAWLAGRVPLTSVVPGHSRRPPVPAVSSGVPSASAA